MSMITYKHTTFPLGFKVSRELVDDHIYRAMRTGLSSLLLGAPRKAPIADWPPKPDNLNVRWWT